MRAKRRLIAALLILSLLLLAGASPPSAAAEPPTLEPLNALKATENTEGQFFSELSASSVASVPVLADRPGMQADAENVELVGQIGGVSYTVAVQGNYAYLGVGPRLVILNVSDPPHPAVVGQTDVLPGFVGAVAVAGGYAYVADGHGNLRIIHVSDPAHPAEVGFCDTPGFTEDVAVAGDYAYIAAGDGGLRIINVADPSAPIEVGFCDTPAYAEDVAVAGDYAYVAASWSGGLRIINVADPADPTEVGFYDAGEEWGARGVAVQGDYAYVADAHYPHYGGLRIINVADPADPTEVSFCDTLYAYGVAVAGGYAYVVAGYYGLRVINVANPTAPAEAGFCDTPGFAVDVAVVGDHAYVAAGEGGPRIINVADPSAPIEVGFCDAGETYDVAVAGDHAYVAAGDGGLGIINISDPAAPIEVGFYNTPERAEDVAVAGGYAYVADRDAGLRIINVSDPAHPTEAGFYNTPGSAYGVAVMGGYAYVADVEGGLFILRFTGAEPTYSITGHIRDGGGGNPIPGVVVSAGAGGFATTDASGAYTITNLITGTYTLTPTKSGWTFTPATRTVSVPPSATGQDFTGSSVLNPPTVTTLPASDPTITTTILNGMVNPHGFDTQAWFEWGTDSGLITYTLTPPQLVGSGTESVTVTATLQISIGVPYYYRMAAQNSMGTAHGDIKRALILLGNDPTGGKDPYWNMYDRLMYFYAHNLNLPATVVKAIIAHESHGLGTDGCDQDTGRCAWSPNERPDRAFLYEPVGIDERFVQNNPDDYSEYRLPNHAPDGGDYPYNPYWATLVQIISGTTNLDMICYVCSYKETEACEAWRVLCNEEKWWSERYDSDKEVYYQQLWGLTHPGGTPTEQFVAQYRLASSYGLGQLVYWWHHDRIEDQAPELFYDPETNVRAMAEYLDSRRRVCTSSLGEDDYVNLDPWEDTVRAYNGHSCGVSYPGFWPGVQLHFPLTQPALAPEDFDASQILTPTLSTSVMTADVSPAFSSPGEYEVDRIVADVKGTGQSQLVALYAQVSDPAIGVDEGTLKVFTDEAGSTVEWESPAMEGVLAEGEVFTETVPESGSPIICAMWGAGAHGARLFPFRWDGQTFQPILAIGSDEEQGFGFFGDAGVGIAEGEIWEGGRDGSQPLSVFHIATYGWEPSTQTFEWVGEETISNATYRLYLPLILRNHGIDWTYYLPVMLKNYP